MNTTMTTVMTMMKMMITVTGQERGGRHHESDIRSLCTIMILMMMITITMMMMTITGHERGGRHNESDIRSELETNRQLYQVFIIILFGDVDHFDYF